MFLKIFWQPPKKKLKVKFSYRSYLKQQAVSYEVKPVFLKQYQNRWYIIAEHSKTYKAFALERIQHLETTTKKFKADLNKVKQQFYNVVGLTNDENQLAQKVVLRFHASQKNYVTSVPIHKLQQEITDNANEYTIHQM